MLFKQGRIGTWIQVCATWKLPFLRLILPELMTYVTKIYQIGLYMLSENLDMILQLKYMPIVMNPARIASSDWKSQKCCGLVVRLIFKTSSVTPDFFYVFNLILSFSTCSQGFKKICAWELLGANVLKGAHSPGF